MFIILWGISLIVCAFLVAVKISKCKKNGWMTLKTSLSGLAVLMLVNAFYSFTGVQISVNYVTVSCSVILGAPGTILLLFLKLLG